jgi:hypothetical protein
MSKFLLNLLAQISKALVNSKIQFLIQKFFFLTFGPALRPTRPLAQPARWPLLSCRLKPTGRPKPLSLRVDGIIVEVRFPF